MCSALIPLNYPKAPEYLNERMDNVGFFAYCQLSSLAKTHLEIFMGLTALFCRILCRWEKLGSIYFTCKNTRGQKSDPCTERGARTGICQPGGGFCGSCCVLLWHFGFFQAKSRPEELGEDS